MRNPFRKRRSRRDQSTLVCRTSFLPPGVTIEYTVSLPLAGRTVAEVFRLIESRLLFPLLRLPFVTDLKGAGPGDQLMVMHGTIIQETGPLPCSWKIRTKFHDFPEKNRIRFTWNEEHEQLEGIERNQLSDREDLDIGGFGITIEFFKNNIITRMTGFGPVAAESLSLSVNRDMLMLTIISEGLEDLMKIPIAAHNLLGILDEVLLSLFKFSLLTDYHAHQEELR